MSPKSIPLKTLAEMEPGDEADAFLLMTRKEELTTRDGKPYFKVGFRDAQREVTFPIWGDSAWAEACGSEWQVGQFYKVRSVYRESSFGAQLEIRKIREVEESDREEGFDPAMCRPSSRVPPAELFAKLMELIESTMQPGSLRDLVRHIYTSHEHELLEAFAAVKNHHAFVGGYLDHVLSMAQTCAYLAEKYERLYPDMQPPLDKDLVVAGGLLHDIGKVLELRSTSVGCEYAPEGHLIGHILLGRDIVRDTARKFPLEGDRLLRLEHIIVSHQRFAEWGSPKPPMTPEALLVHYADDIDAKFHMMAMILQEDHGSDPVTSSRNVLRQHIYRGDASSSPNG